MRLRRAVERRERVWRRLVVVVPWAGVVSVGRDAGGPAMLEEAAVVTVLAERAVPLVRVRERRISSGVGRWPS
jgi:hypothetical protein